MKILAIETSCDETACAVVEDGTKIISNVVASSRDMHEKYGGIVPEVAAREQLKSILPVIREALFPLKKDPSMPVLQCLNKSIDAIAVTIGPGLIGSLLVGVETAKTIAYVTGKPIIPVNHVIAHMYANFVNSAGKRKEESVKNINFPAISLVVSGGHTELYLMKSIKEVQWLGGTLDDAAGEAFDKTARLLGFGHGGGAAIEGAAARFQPTPYPLRQSSREASNVPASPKLPRGEQPATQLPRPLLHDKTLNFSFSGLKTAVLREVNKLKQSHQFNNETIQQLAHEVQEAITDVLVEKTIRAAREYDVNSILLSGGVAANSRLREKFTLHPSRFTLAFPPVSLCTDNAVYIASCAYYLGKKVSWKDITAIPDLSVEVRTAVKE
ncbi:MAG: tRNA (adenosine(37)-N6)-threonylcarbamoyltransferase complex transferase subunit TsaD [bacterium]|nr:tRNA (adenosine(37)-N6)-threonylcarbamoyltransferase complex transferase subunit TsaD [bacterium]